MLFGGPPFSDERHDPSVAAQEGIASDCWVTNSALTQFFLDKMFGRVRHRLASVGNRESGSLIEVTSARVMHWRRWFKMPPDPNVGEQAGVWTEVEMEMEYGLELWDLVRGHSPFLKQLEI